MEQDRSLDSIKEMVMRKITLKGLLNIPEKDHLAESDITVHCWAEGTKTKQVAHRNEQGEVVARYEVTYRQDRESGSGTLTWRKSDWEPIV
ncbi:hypothetical protein [Pseudomonas sp. NPDC089396]|uniref:hypothetical protein n=1 Tax=Pseudomonas sp. NPDC089396 TaxID=3364461 RepID=UPI00383464AE